MQTATTVVTHSRLPIAKDLRVCGDSGLGRAHGQGLPDVVR